jgi:CheY-like chemotaxis protein
MSDEQEPIAVLVVEDDPLTITFIKGVLEPFGYQVFNVTNGKSALLALMKYEFNLVIMDIKMPIYDGKSATIDIKNNSKLKKTPIVAISGSTEAKVKEDAMFSGADKFLKKPLNKEELVDVVSQLIYEYGHMNEE